MNRLHRLTSLIAYNFHPARLLKLNRIAVSFHTSFATHSAKTSEPPLHEFLTIQRILPDKIFVPIMRTIYSTNNLTYLRSLISQLSPDFKRKHYQVVFFWSDVNAKDLINLNLTILKPVHIQSLEKFASFQKLTYASLLYYAFLLQKSTNAEMHTTNICGKQMFSNST